MLTTMPTARRADVVPGDLNPVALKALGKMIRNEFSHLDVYLRLPILIK